MSVDMMGGLGSWAHFKQTSGEVLVSPSSSTALLHIGRQAGVGGRKPPG